LESFSTVIKPSLTSVNNTISKIESLNEKSENDCLTDVIESNLNEDSCVEIINEV